MIWWVKSFGILYFLLRIGDPAEGLRASQKTACEAGQIHHGRCRAWHRKFAATRQSPADMAMASLLGFMHGSRKRRRLAPSKAKNNRTRSAEKRKWRASRPTGAQGATEYLTRLRPMADPAVTL
jgi:hypothetical protein